MAWPLFAKLAAAVWPNTAQKIPADSREWGLTVETALNAHFSLGNPMWNGKIVPSVAANVLTITLQTAAGAAPSSADPVYVGFRKATIADGAADIVRATAATTLVVPAGATLGALADIPFRLWVVAYNDGGTVRLGVSNRLVAQYLTVWSLYNGMIYGASEISDAADGNFIYASAEIEGPIVVLGHLDWGAGLPTPGMWSSGPTTVQPFGPGARLPGDVLQTSRLQTGATVSGSTQTPWDDSIPQNTEGVEMLADSIAPLAMVNLYRVRGRALVSSSAAAHLTGALHINSVADALTAASVAVADADTMVEIHIDFMMRPADDELDEFSLRVGASTSATVLLNGASSARKLGGVANSYLEIEEIQG